MINHEMALILIRTNHTNRAPKWVRPAVLERMRAQQGKNVAAMLGVARSAARQGLRDQQLEQAAAALTEHLASA